MPNYRRNFIPGGTYFFTIVTYNRKPIFKNNEAKKLLWQIYLEVQKQKPFTSEVFCLLPDHLHCIWTLPEADFNYSLRIKEIKRIFTFKYQQIFSMKQMEISNSRKKKKEGMIWQRRFWEHTIRDSNEYSWYMDYIHWNPVKHGYVDSPDEWEFTSFHRYVSDGIYPPGWECIKKDQLLDVNNEWD